MAACDEGASSRIYTMPKAGNDAVTDVELTEAAAHAVISLPLQPRHGLVYHRRAALCGRVLNFTLVFVHTIHVNTLTNTEQIM